MIPGALGMGAMVKVVVTSCEGNGEGEVGGRESGAKLPALGKAETA